MRVSWCGSLALPTHKRCWRLNSYAGGGFPSARNRLFVPDFCKAPPRQPVCSTLLFQGQAQVCPAVSERLVGSQSAQKSVLVRLLTRAKGPSERCKSCNNARSTSSSNRINSLPPGGGHHRFSKDSMQQGQFTMPGKVHTLTRRHLAREAKARQSSQQPDRSHTLQIALQVSVNMTPDKLMDPPAC